MPEPLESFIYTDFRGGLNTQDGPFELDDNEAQDLLNVSLSQRGALQKRAGKTRFDTSGFPSTLRAEHVRAWYPGTSKYLLASIDGDIYSFTVGGVATHEVVGSSGANHTWAMEQMQDAAGVEHLWCANGFDQPRVLTTGLMVTNWTAVNLSTYILRVWRNRMISVRHNLPLRLIFSKIGDPETYNALDFQDVKGSEEDLEPITWLEVLGDNLIVFKRNSVWSVYNEPPNIALKRIGTPGCEDRFQTCVVGDRVYWWARNGVWSTDGVEAPVYESKSIENFIAERHDFSRSNRVRLCSSPNRRVYVMLAIDGAAVNNHMFELITDLDEQEEGVQGPWIRHDLPVASMCVFRPGEVDVLIGGSANQGKLHTLFDGLTDEGTSITSYWKSSWKALFGDEPIERLRRLNLQMFGRATVEVFKDFDDTPSFTGTVVQSGFEGFQRVRPESRGRYHCFKVSNTHSSDPMKILSIEMIVRGGAKEVHS